MTLRDRVEAVNQSRGHLCVGVDPRPHRFPEGYGGAHDLEAWCRDLVEATAPHAAAVKPNLGFFLAQGPDGIEALAATVEAAREADAFTILDGKFGDIGSTAQAYARFADEVAGADAVTLNPYLGTDALEAFLDRGLGAFVLARTTNPSAAEIQEPVAGRVVQRFQRDDVGFVAPGNAPDTARHVRQTAGVAPMLLPGVGTQGGKAGQAARTARGGPFLVAIARAIAHADGPFPEAAAEAAEGFHDEIEAALGHA